MPRFLLSNVITYILFFFFSSSSFFFFFCSWCCCWCCLNFGFMVYAHCRFQGLSLYSTIFPYSSAMVVYILYHESIVWHYLATLFPSISITYNVYALSSSLFILFDQLNHLTFLTNIQFRRLYSVFVSLSKPIFHCLK